MARLVAAWDLRGAGRLPSPDEIQAAMPVGPLGGLELATGAARRLLPATGVEEGGFGKGVALAAATSAALAAGADCVLADLGGQLALAGACPAVDLDLAHPAERGHAVARLVMSAGSVATSGGSERSLEVAGQRIHHILDPRSGRPAAFTGSATVLDPDPVAADALATALVVMGWDEGRRWLAARPEVEALLAVVAGDRVHLAATPVLAASLTPLLPDVTLELIPRVTINGSN
jgi:thiamine biosynthesis lipoprotein